jgi:hypothetical protein
LDISSEATNAPANGGQCGSLSTWSCAFWINHFGLSLRLDDHLECFGLSAADRGLIGIEDLIKLEAMRDGAFGVDLASPDKRCFSSGRQGLFNAPLVSRRMKLDSCAGLLWLIS